MGALATVHLKEEDAVEPKEIKRINFFDGQFLTQSEFRAEQLYHMYMRRRLNYILFDGSGVVDLEVGVDPTDLRLEPVNPPDDKTFRVTAGMAISRRADLLEGREIVRTRDQATGETFDLAETVGAGASAFVAVHYEETLQEPQTSASPETETRLRERAVISLHGPNDLPDNEQYILLGTIDFNNMSVDYTLRRTVRIRSSLIGGGGTSPTISTISRPISGEPGTSMLVTITGTNLSGATVVSSHPDVTPTAVTTSDTTINLTLNIGSAVSGTVTLTVDNETPPPATTTFTVEQVVPAATIATISPSSGAPATSVPVTLRGTNLSGASVESDNDGVELADVTTWERRINLTLNIGSDVSGSITLTVDNGIPPPATTTFTVEQVVPTVIVRGFWPDRALIHSDPRLRNDIHVFGTNIRHWNDRDGDPLSATEIRLVDPNNPSNVVATLYDLSVSLDFRGHQQVSGYIPGPEGFTARLSEVRVQVAYENVAGIGIGTSETNLKLGTGSV